MKSKIADQFIYLDDINRTRREIMMQKPIKDKKHEGLRTVTRHIREVMITAQTVKEQDNDQKLS